MGSVGLIHCPGVNLLISGSPQRVHQKGRNAPGKLSKKNGGPGECPMLKMLWISPTHVSHNLDMWYVEVFWNTSNHPSYGWPFEYWHSWWLGVPPLWETSVCVYIYIIYSIFVYTHAHWYIQTQLVGGFNDFSPMMVPGSWLSETCSGSTSNSTNFSHRKCPDLWWLNHPIFF